MVLSADPKHDPVSARNRWRGRGALAISDIPFHHVLGGVRVGIVERQVDRESKLRRDHEGPN